MRNRSVSDVTREYLLQVSGWSKSSIRFSADPVAILDRCQRFAVSFFTLVESFDIKGRR